MLDKSRAIVTIADLDARPDPFSFQSISGAATGTIQTSNSVSITGINAPSPISVSGGTYSIGSGTFTGTPGSVLTGQTVRLRQTASASPGASTNAVLTVGDVSSTFTVTTSAAALPTISIDDIRIPEGNAGSTTARFTVRISAPSSSPVTAQLVATDGTAKNGSDYSRATGSVIFEPGVVKKTIPVTVVGDTLYEADETFFIDLSTPTGAIFSKARGVATIVNDDAELDTTPDTFVIAPKSSVERSSEQISDPVVVSGITAATDILVSGGSYSIDEAPFTTSPGKVIAGQRVRVRQVSASTFSTSITATLRIGSFETLYVVTTRAADTSPDAFTLSPRSESALDSFIDSDLVRVSGIEFPSEISVSGGLYSIDGGNFRDTPSQVDAGSIVVVRLKSSSNFEESRAANLIIGDKSAEFVVTTRAADTSPDAFTIAPRSESALDSFVDSDAVRVGGIETLTGISVTGGSYSIDGGNFRDTPSKVGAGSLVVVRLKSSSNFEEIHSAHLTIGDVSAEFVVTTRAADISPDTFHFARREDAELNTPIDSDPIRIVGIEVPVAVTIRGGSYSVDGGPFTEVGSRVSSGSTITVRVQSSPDHSSNRSATLTVGDVSADFSVTTAAADTTPDPFRFEPRERVLPGRLISSSAIVVAGINAPASVSIVGGFYSINGGVFTDAPGFVSSGATIRIEVLSGFGFAEFRTATLTVGGLTGDFNVTTRDVVDDGTPDPLVFEAVINAEPATRVVSAPVRISGINIAVPIAVVGGRYQINGGEFTDSTGEVTNGDTVVVEIYSAAERGETRILTLTVDDVATDFMVTTAVTASLKDSDPDIFVFEPSIGVEPGIVSTSEMVAINGIDTAAQIYVSGGRYRINGSAPMDMIGEVLPGDLVSVDVMASSEFASTSSATLIIGSVSSVYSVTTRAPDLQPNEISFAPIVDANPGSTLVSSAVMLDGFETEVPIRIIGGLFRVNSGPFSAAETRVRPGDSIEVQIVAANAFSETVSATVSVGGVNTVFSASTRRADVTPDPVIFSRQPHGFPGLATVSEAVTISGIEVPVPIRVTGGLYSVNGGPFVEGEGPVSAGDKIRAMVFAGPNLRDIRTATLTVGSLQAMFDVVTDAPIDTVPDFIRFPERIVPRSTITDSDPVVVRGINSDTAISVSGGMFSINGGPFVSSAAVVRGGDIIVLRATAGSLFNSYGKVVLNVGGQVSEWVVRTEQQPGRLNSFALNNSTTYKGGLVVPSSTQLSEPIWVLDAAIPSTISISGGSYSINDGPFTTAQGQVVRGDKVVVRLIAPASFQTTTSATLSIGSRTSTMSVTTTKDSVASTPSAYSDCTSHVYRELSPVPMRLFVCRPSGWKISDRRPAFVHWFGGGFFSGTTDNSIGEARYWAKTQGMVGIAPDYRVNERFSGYATLTIDDARAALRWIVNHADELGVDVSRIALSGSSAGGGAAAFASLAATPVTARPDDDPGIRPAALISRSGVLDTTTREQDIQYLSSFRFGPQAAAVSPRRNLDPHFPATLIFHGDQDTVVAPVPSMNLCSALLVMGKVCEFRSQAGLNHELGVNTTQIREEIAGFLQRVGVLQTARP